MVGFLSKATKPHVAKENVQILFFISSRISPSQSLKQKTIIILWEPVLQQALGYAEILDVPVAFSSNGDGFVQHDRSGLSPQIEKELSLDNFPSPAKLWEMYKKYKNIETPEQEEIASFDYFFDGSGRAPRYYQQIAINRTVEAIAKGQNRILLVMATGTGKTYTAFQIIYRLWKNGQKKREFSF